MSGKELLKMDAAGLAKLSDAQLKAYFAPYLVMIRPEEKEEEKKEMNLGAKAGPKKYYKGPTELEKTKELFNRMAKKMGMEGI